MTEMWDKLPEETAKAWSAFQIYRDLPPHNEVQSDRRGFKNVADRIGHKSLTMVSDWSRKFGWVERSRAYDAHLGQLALTFHEVEIERYQQHVIESTIQQITIADKALNIKLTQAIAILEDDSQPADGIYKLTVDPIDLLRLATAIEKLDNLKRRIGRMPTNYKSSTAEDTPDDAVFIVEGN